MMDEEDDDEELRAAKAASLGQNLAPFIHMDDSGEDWGEKQGADIGNLIPPKNFPEPKKLLSGEPEMEQLLDSFVRSLEITGAFAEPRASNKDPTNRWYQFCLALYNPETGIARGYKQPEAHDKVSNLKSKTENTLWPAIEKRVEMKKQCGEALTWAEETSILHMKMYQVNKSREVDKKRAEVRKEHNLEVAEVALGAGPDGTKKNVMLTHHPTFDTATGESPGKVVYLKDTPPTSSSLVGTLASTLVAYLNKGMEKENASNGAAQGVQQIRHDVTLPPATKPSSKRDRLHQMDHDLFESMKEAKEIGDVTDYEFLQAKRQKIHEQLYGTKDQDVIDLLDDDNDEMRGMN